MWSWRAVLILLLATSQPLPPIRPLPPHLATTVCSFGYTPVHMFMMYNKNITVEVLQGLKAVDHEVFTRTNTT